MCSAQAAVPVAHMRFSASGAVLCQLQESSQEASHASAMASPDGTLMLAFSL